MDNNSRGNLERLGSGLLGQVDYVEGDIRDASTVRAAVDGMDLVVNMAFINGTKYFYEVPERVIEVGVKGSLNVLEACIDAGVRQYVYASSSEVYQTPEKVPTAEDVPASIPDVLNARYSYGGTKLMGEIMAFNYGRKSFDRTMVFRPHNVYGPNMGFEHVIPDFVVKLERAARASAGGPVQLEIQGDGQETRAFNFVDDFTAGLLTLLDSGEDQTVYHIGTDEEVSIAALADEVARVMGLEIEVVPTPLRPGGTPRRCPDISRLKALGYAPTVDLAEGLSLTVPWYQEWVGSQLDAGV